MNRKKLSILVDVLLFISLLGVMISPFLIPPFLNPDLPGRGMTNFTQFMRYMHVWLGYSIGVLMLVHICLTWNWIKLSSKNFKKVKKIVKFQYILIWILFIAMGISIWSGVIWDVRGVAPTPMLRAVHAISSWLALLCSGLHVGMHMPKFTSFFNKKTGKCS